MVAAIVGDITPVDGVSDEEKHQLEAAAMARIRAMLGSDTAAGQLSMNRRRLRRRRHAYQYDGCCECSAFAGYGLPAGQEVEELWQEYEAASSPEAMLVKDFDKVRVACDTDIGTCQCTLAVQLAELRLCGLRAAGDDTAGPGV